MESTPEQSLPPRLADPHVHLWDLQRLDLPWLGPPLNRSFLLSDYLAAVKGLGVRQAVYVEVGVSAEHRYEEAELISALCAEADNPLAGVVMSGDVTDARLFEYLRGTDARWIKAVRQGLPADLEADGSFVRGVQRLGEMAVHFELNTDPARALRLVERCSGTRFVLDHCGGATFDIMNDTRRASEWARLMTAIGRHENVACKLSGIIATAPMEQWRDEMLAGVVNHLLEAFGVRRLMFASDWPICTLSASLRGWAGTLGRLLQDRSEVDRTAIFHDTAVRWYALQEED